MTAAERWERLSRMVDFIDSECKAEAIMNAGKLGHGLTLAEIVQRIKEGRP